MSPPPPSKMSCDKFSISLQFTAVVECLPWPVQVRAVSEGRLLNFVRSSFLNYFCLHVLMLNKCALQIIAMSFEA